MVGEVMEQEYPYQSFFDPQHERTRYFLERVIMAL
jgi:ABC-type polar amino acid transport system ATPase subunit